MKKILALLALTLSATLSHSAEATVKLFCEKPAFIENILREHKEELIFVGMDNIHKIEGLTSSVFYNQTTKTYSILFSAQSGEMVCVISSGVLGKFIFNQ